MITKEEEEHLDAVAFRQCLADNQVQTDSKPKEFTQTFTWRFIEAFYRRTDPGIFKNQNDQR